MLAAARAGDEDAFSRLVEPHRRELHAHCYRMLGSVYDAEDAEQEALLRAWRAIARFEGRSSLRSWLYRIATNTCLDQISRRPKRVLPIDYGPAADPHFAPGQPVVESVWLEPCPDELLGRESSYTAPQARYERSESVELAFIAALQPEERVPEQSQGSAAYVDAWERCDVEAFAAMLTEDATFAMPPLATLRSVPGPTGSRRSRFTRGMRRRRPTWHSRSTC
jgi:RNA polymerase sigma-70 factor, ECF subfamily